MKRLAAILFALASTCLPVAAHAAEIVWNAYPKSAEVHAKHVGTGLAIGAASMAVCDEIALKMGRHQPTACALATLALGAALYAAKEIHDTEVYEHGRYFEMADYTEGVGGMTVGVGAVYALVEW